MPRGAYLMHGFEIKQRDRKVGGQTVEQAKEIGVAAISDSMSRLYAGGARLRPLHKAGKLAGPALTVRTRPGDNLMMQKAIDLAEPGDVLVVDGGGEVTNALTGELMIRYAATKGIAGFVIWGAVRDLAFIENGAFPVYAAGVTHRGPYKDGPGTINEVIALDGMTIAPGDLIVGDRDGIVSIGIDDADVILARALAVETSEKDRIEKIEAGTSDRSWIDARLRDLGVLS